jgi:thymidylate synthase
MSYSPAYKPNQLIVGTGRVVIVTGWTVRGAVAKRLDPSEYAAIGNLYSPTRGLSPLIRNLSLNPQVSAIVLISGTREDENAGAVQALWDFWLYGYDQGVTDTGCPAWKVRSQVKGFIDIEIPRDRLEAIRYGVSFYRAMSITDAVGLVKNINATPQPDPWGSPEAYPVAESVPTVLPGARYGHRIEGKTIAETWVKILHRIKTTGTIRPTGYDDQWQELINLMAVVTDEPPGFHFPEPNYLPIDRDYIDSYLPQILEDAPYVEGVKYSYGQRIRSWFGRDQVEQVVAKLSGEIDAASAVISLWDVRDHVAGGSPCLNHIWVRIVGGELSLTAVFRSNDMFSAWPANAMGLRALQQHILDRVATESGQPLTLGPLMTLSQSAHIYGDTWDSVDAIVHAHYRPALEYSDPVGNFVIETEGTAIAVTQTTPGSGEAVRSYRGTIPMTIAREICDANPGMQPHHAAYLGMELQKARDSVRTGKTYHQDR